MISVLIAVVLGKSDIWQERDWKNVNSTLDHLKPWVWWETEKTFLSCIALSFRQFWIIWGFTGERKMKTLRLLKPVKARVQNHPVGRCRYGGPTSSSPKLGRQLHWLNCALRLGKPNEILVVKNYFFFFPKEAVTTFRCETIFYEHTGDKMGGKACLWGGADLHSSGSRLAGAQHWVFLLSTNSVQTSHLKLVLSADYGLGESLFLLPPCPLSHTGFRFGDLHCSFSLLSSCLTRHIPVITCSCSNDLQLNSQIHTRTKHFIF